MNQFTKKALSVFLSVLMVFTLFGGVIKAPVAYAAPTSADYDALADAIRVLRASTNDILTVGSTEDRKTATYSDATGGLMIDVAERYYSVFNGLKPAGNITQNTTSYRNAAMIHAEIKTQVSNRFTSEELNSYRIVALLDSLIADQTGINTSLENTAAQTAPDITVTVYDALGMLAYDSVADLPESIVGTYTYTYDHSSPSYESGSGCNAKTYYYVKLDSANRTTGDVISTAPVKTLKEKIVAYADYYGCSFSELVAEDADTLTAVRNDLSGAYAAVDAVVYERFFGDIDTETLLGDLDAAISISEYVDKARELQGLTATDISAFTFDELSAFYFDMAGKLDTYNAAPSATRAFLEEQGYIVMADVEAKFEEVQNAYEIAYLRDTLKPRIEEDLELYATYTDEWTVAAENVGQILEAAVIEINSIKEDIAGKKAENVAVVFGEDYDIEEVFAPVLTQFERVTEVDGYNLEFKAYQSVYNSVFEPLTLTETDTQLLNILRSRDAWFTELQQFAAALAEYDPNVASLILTNAEAAMESKINNTYAALNAILEDQIDTAWAIYQTQRDEYGLQITEVNLATYNTLMQSVGLINKNAYEFLNETTAHFDLSAETVEKYSRLQDIVIALDNWDPSRHLSAYAYNAETMDPIVRYVSEKDVARNLDYTVTEEFLQTVIDLLRGLIGGDALADLGMELDLSSKLDSVWDTFYTDKFVNTLMGALYPMLSELVRDKLNDLVGSYLSMLGDLDDAFAKLSVGLAPKKVGTYVNSTKYPAIASALKGVSGGFMDGEGEGDNCWTSAEARREIWREVVDDDGNPVLDEDGAPTYELIFDWGIDAAEGMEAKKEAFLDAVDAALKGIQPLFMALLCNKAVPTTQVAEVKIIVTVATVSIGMFANDGYNNTLLPILEAMGVHADALYDAKTYTNVRDIFEYGILSPLADLFDQIKEDPINKILDILPTLAFAVQNNLFIELLHNLKVDLDVQGGGCAGSIIQGQLPPEGVSIDLHDELKFDELLGIETFYEDILSMDGVLGIVLGLLAGDEEEPAEGEEPAEPAPALTLPHLDGAKLAMLGTDVVWADSYRSKSQITYQGRVNVHANIISNKTQVVQFLLEFLLEAIHNEEFIPAVLYMVNKDKAEEEQVTLPELAESIIANINESGTDAIAALAELVFPQRYAMDAVKRIAWITEGNIGAEDYENYWTDVDAEGNETLWTKDKAVFMAEHLDEFLDDVVLIFGENLGNAETLGDAVAYLTNTLFTAQTANDLAGTIKDLLGGLELPEAIAELGLLEQLGLDLTAWDDMSFEFEDGDAAAFKAALIEILEPLAPILRFILAEDSIQITLLDMLPVTALGYDGYSYGIVPLMEALGCTGVKSTAAFKADKANIVKNIVEPIFSLFDKLQTNPVGFIEDFVPSMLYFDKVGGVQTAVENLLFAVNVLLDTIRPVYDVDLYGLVAEKLGVDLHFAETDPVNFLLMKLGDLITENTDIELKIDFTVESLSEKLHFTDPVRFRSANGDDAYTIRLTDEGKADLLTQVLDYGIDQVIFEDNITNLEDALKEMVSDEEALALLTSILEIVKSLDKEVQDFRGINDVALAAVFWMFFGADTVTDATADFFYRYKDGGFVEVVGALLQSGSRYADRFAFIMEEVVSVEYPNLMQALENGKDLLKPPMDYTPEERHYVASMLARVIVFLQSVFAYLRSIFNK